MVRPLSECYYVRVDLGVCIPPLLGLEEGLCRLVTFRATVPSQHGHEWTWNTDRQEKKAGARRDAALSDGETAPSLQAESLFYARFHEAE